MGSQNRNSLIHTPNPVMRSHLDLFPQYASIASNINTRIPASPHLLLCKSLLNHGFDTNYWVPAVGSCNLEL
jgi:hypothetical protein